MEGNHGTVTETKYGITVEHTEPGEITLSPAFLERLRQLRDPPNLMVYSLDYVFRYKGRSRQVSISQRLNGEWAYSLFGDGASPRLYSTRDQAVDAAVEAWLNSAKARNRGKPQHP